MVPEAMKTRSLCSMLCKDMVWEESREELENIFFLYYATTLFYSLILKTELELCISFLSYAQLDLWKPLLPEDIRAGEDLHIRVPAPLVQEVKDSLDQHTISYKYDLSFPDRKGWL